MISHCREVVARLPFCCRVLYYRKVKNTNKKEDDSIVPFFVGVSYSWKSSGFMGRMVACGSPAFSIYPSKISLSSPRTWA